MSPADEGHVNMASRHAQDACRNTWLLLKARLLLGAPAPACLPFHLLTWSWPLLSCCHLQLIAPQPRPVQGSSSLMGSSSAGRHQQRHTGVSRGSLWRGGRGEGR